MEIKVKQLRHSLDFSNVGRLSYWWPALTIYLPSLVHSSLNGPWLAEIGRFGTGDFHRHSLFSRLFKLSYIQLRGCATAAPAEMLPIGTEKPDYRERVSSSSGLKCHTPVISPLIHGD